MPYSKRYKKRSNKPRAYRRKSNAVGQLAKRVSKLSMLVKPEFKYISAVASVTPSSTVPTQALLNGMASGDGVGQREGRQIFIKSVQGLIHVNINASATHTHVRYALLIDKAPAGATFSTGALYDVSMAGYVDSFRNLDYRRKFIILKEGNFQLDALGPREKIIKFYHKLNLRVQYDDSDAGSIADIQTNALYLMLMSDEATNTPTCIYNMRIRYLDN